MNTIETMLPVVAAVQCAKGALSFIAEVDEDMAVAIVKDLTEAVKAKDGAEALRICAAVIDEAEVIGEMTGVCVKDVAASSREFVAAQTAAFNEVS